MVKVFISYRRSDSIYAVDRLDERLKHAFGSDAIFRDLRSIRKGQDFPSDIRTALNEAHLGLVVIGPSWLNVGLDDKNGVAQRRLDDPKDFVRIEIETLLQRSIAPGQSIPVIPLFVGGADMPKADDLPGSLKPLSYRDGMPLRPDPDFEESIRQVIEHIAKTLGVEPRPFQSHQAVSAQPTRISPTRLTVTGTKFVGRAKELHLLNEALGRSRNEDKINIISFIGQGGEGKTALVLDWYSRCARNSWRGVQRVFDWSFYSQGINTQSAANADEFFARAFTWFGYMGEVPRDPWTKGEKLAELISAERTLLVLDGLEPLQHPGGEFKDRDMKALLRALAMHNPGLCILTSRTDVADIKDFEREEGCCIRHLLRELDLDAARQLLRDFRVCGPDAELDKAIEWFMGHAYDLNLLGNYLDKCTNDHDIQQWQEILLLKEDEYVHGRHNASGKREGHGVRMLRAYERWLGSDSAAVAALRLLGLFDRPARSDLFGQLRVAPAITGLTEGLVNISNADWLRMLDQLQNLSLVRQYPTVVETHKSSSTTNTKVNTTSRTAIYLLDTHPLLREHFAEDVHTTKPESWKAAHRRIYHHLKVTTEFQPATLEGLQPLYQAVAHGCQAGEFRDAFKRVLRDRILRGTFGRDAFFSTRKLGAWVSQLSAIRCFFHSGWSSSKNSLDEQDRAWLLNEAGLCLIVLGRLEDAIQPLRLSLAIREGLRDWDQAAVSANHLSELYMILGNLEDTGKTSEHAVEYSYAGTIKWYRRRDAKTFHAYCLHQQGKRQDSKTEFESAETIQRNMRHPSPPLIRPLLYGTQGYYYCSMLLSPAECYVWRLFDNSRHSSPKKVVSDLDQIECCRDIIVRAMASREIVMGDFRNLIDIALDNLTQARALFYISILDGTAFREPLSALKSPIKFLAEAMTTILVAGETPHLPRSLLTRSWLWFLQNNTDNARRDLAQAQQIAERGSMKLHLADVHLYRARLFREKDELSKARNLIEQCGYWRRKEELENAEEAAKSW